MSDLDSNGDCASHLRFFHRFITKIGTVLFRVLACLEGLEPSTLGLEANILAIRRQTHLAHRGRFEHPTFGFGDQRSTTELPMCVYYFLYDF